MRLIGGPRDDAHRRRPGDTTAQLVPPRRRTIIARTNDTLFGAARTANWRNWREGRAQRRIRLLIFPLLHKFCKSFPTMQQLKRYCLKWSIADDLGEGNGGLSDGGGRDRRLAVVAAGGRPRRRDCRRVGREAD